MKRWLLILSVGLLAVGLAGLQSNAAAARRLAKAIQATDSAGGDVTTGLLQLNDYSSSHMGATISLKLKASYDRAVQQAQAAAAPDVNGQAYAQAQAACARGDSIQQAACVRQYLTSHTQPVSTKPLVLPEEKTFVHEFRSPGWTPDLAGLGLAAGFGGLLLSAWFSLFRR